MGIFNFGRKDPKDQPSKDQPPKDTPAASTPAGSADSAEKPRGLLDRLKAGLAKTAQVLRTDVRDLFKREGRLVDEDFLDDAGLYASADNCGSCGVVCDAVFPSALVTECRIDAESVPPFAACALVSCAPGTHLAGSSACVPDVPSLCLSCTTDADCAVRAPGKELGAGLIGEMIHRRMTQTVTHNATTPSPLGGLSREADQGLGEGSIQQQMPLLVR